jgi:hypothetical protein
MFFSHIYDIVSFVCGCAFNPPCLITDVQFRIILKYILVPLLAFSITASVTSSTEKIKTKTTIVMEKETLWLELNQFNKKVFTWPFFILSYSPFSPLITL